MKFNITTPDDFIKLNWVKDCKNGFFGIMISEVWVGRPFDEMYKMEKMELLGNTITITTGEGNIQIIIKNLREIEINNRVSLSFIDFDQILITGKFDGKTKIVDDLKPGQKLTLVGKF